jgi:Protein of unknown function (DUF3142)
MSWLRLVALTITLIAASIVHTACGRTQRTERAERTERADPATLAHDAYIWQRQWTASLDRALIASASRVRVWRVLAAEIEGRGSGQIVESSPHFDVLARAGRPVIPVIRISGRLSDWDEDDLVRHTKTLVKRWRDAGIEVAGVEVDHDCPTSSLRRYASFLATLRLAHPRDVALSITALPAWLDSARLRDVLQQVDEAVLQVHAVEHPGAGLFDRDRARDWARAWAEVSNVRNVSGANGVPFRIALPTYGSRVTWTRAGRITAIESERRTFADPASGRELFVAPSDVTTFLDSVRDDRLPHLTGFVWFRVPTAEDERAWSLETWHAVMDGRVPPGEIDATAEPSAELPGLYDVYLHNRGNIDAIVPERVRITSTGACESADAVAPYAMEKGRMAIEFRRVTPRLLARDRRTLIGWVRCPIGEIQIHGGS